MPACALRSYRITNRMASARTSRSPSVLTHLDFGVPMSSEVPCEPPTSEIQGEKLA
jgi:hypothetical protein